MGQRGVKPEFVSEHRVAVLGLSASGKSTFIRQMKILEKIEFTQSEVEAFSVVILNNLVFGMKELTFQAQKLEYQVSGENRKNSRYFQELEPFTDCKVDELVVRKMKSLWQDPAIQKTWAVSPYCQLQMSQMDYFVARMEEVIKPGFLPTPEDMVRCRQRTTGIVDNVFVRNNHLFRLLDLGGQKSERSKWISIMTEQEVNAIIFFVSLEEFNFQSTEEKNKTNLEVAIQTWSEIVSYFRSKRFPILLAFNKLDLFERRISTSFLSFSKQFRDYTGPETQDGALNFMKQLFLDVLPDDMDRSLIMTDYFSVSSLEQGAVSTVIDNFFKKVVDLGGSDSMRRSKNIGNRSARGNRPPGDFVRS
eukprot:TRINITY_DN1044_c0_g1_i1.p2 TRINITY_DN1044_c0_g1~~TRINITY_DN1044_c0_g1_i1.p2  ORF type:complete len:362 (-),score=64.55 TRINITY_DN1044_c0_g1_i1:177-1262(-)